MKPGRSLPFDRDAGPVPLHEVSLIIPAHNAGRTLDGCLQAVLPQMGEGKVIVVDDGSTDDTAQVASRYGVRLVCQPNRGAAAARNLGAREASGTLLLFLDADCVPAPGWVEAFALRFRDPAVAGAKGIVATRQRALVARFVQLEYETKYDNLSKREQIDFIDAASAAYRRDVFLRSGGFDEHFAAASAEDAELSFRLASEGHKLVFVPEAVVYHPHPTALKSYFRRKFNYGYWRVRVYQRHPEKVVADSYTPQSLKLQIGLAGLACLCGIAGVTWRRAWVAGGLSLAVFGLTTLPFVRRARPLGWGLALVSPLIILLRALALGGGLATGLAALVITTLSGRQDE